MAKNLGILTYDWWGQRFLESCNFPEYINGKHWIRIFTGGRDKADTQNGQHRVNRREQESGKISDYYVLWTNLSLSLKVRVCVCVCPGYWEFVQQDLLKLQITPAFFLASHLPHG